MNRSRIPSPARSLGVSPRKHTPRRSRSVCSAKSNVSVPLTKVISDSFYLSTMPNRRSVLNDDSDIEIPEETKMNRSRIPSPARSLGVPPRKHTPRRSRSVCSAKSNVSVPLTKVISDSFYLSPMPNRRSVLNDGSDIEIPGRKSWAKKLGENSRVITELFKEEGAVVNNAAKELNVEILSQGEKNYSVDLPESKDGESIKTIVIRQRKLFTQKENQVQNKFKNIIDNRETPAKLQKSHFDQEKDIDVGPKKQFNKAPKPRTKPFFPTAILNISSKAVNETKETPVPEVKCRSFFDNRPRKLPAAKISETINTNSTVNKARQSNGSATSENRSKASTSKLKDKKDEELLSTSKTKEILLKRKNYLSLNTSSNVRITRSKNKAMMESPLKGGKRRKLHDKSKNKSQSQLNTMEVQEGDKQNESEDEQETEEQVRRGVALSPTSSIDLELDDWKHLPSSTKVENHFEETTSLVKRARLRKLPAAKKSETINTNSTVNKTRQSNESATSKNRSKASTSKLKDKKDEELLSTSKTKEILLKRKNYLSLNTSSNVRITRSKSKAMMESPLKGGKRRKLHDKSKNKSQSQLNTPMEVQEGDKQNESEDEQETEEQVRRGVVLSPTSSIDLELDDWKHLPSSTMVENHFEETTSLVKKDEELLSSRKLHDKSKNRSQSQLNTPMEVQEGDKQNESEDEQETEEQVRQDESEAEQETEEQIQQNESDNINSDNQEQNYSKSNHNETEEQQNKAMEVEDEEGYEGDVEAQNETENQESENYDSNDTLENESNLSENDEQEEQFESDQEKSEDVPENEVIETSGWDSHSETRKTLRLTLGKDFSPRKSLQALVMEKSANRHTNITEVTTKIPQANSTELPAFDSNEDAAKINEIIEEPSDHEISPRTRRTTLENYFQKIKQENLEMKRRMEEKIRASLKVPKRDIHNPFKFSPKPVRRTKPVQNKPKPKQTKPSIIPLNMLPLEFLEDMKYKPPKRFKPRNVSWITKRLYNFLENKLEPKYDYRARVRAERFVKLLYDFTRVIKRRYKDQAVDTLKKEMARLKIVKTHFEFYDFFSEFMPREIRIKVIPDIINKLPLPSDIFSEILQ